MEQNKLFKLVIREKSALMLINILNSNNSVYISSIARNISCTVPHAVTMLNKLKDYDIVTFDNIGRINIVKLTAKGRELSEHLNSIYNITK